ncbi:hypothetical protein DPMN_105622 [Dreissena polymorpha]|uniref:Uncharacterized protein n=1 Tax=Dreissena polymorpha TaxID=45954 RepID=A0A9D4QIW1_DREPO|nr:hypothetical protein DPMN_105622 [Dreissena polymorpha]
MYQVPYAEKLTKGLHNHAEVNICIFFGESLRVKTRRDAADRCRGRNRRGVTPRIIAECLGMMPREYSLWMRSNFENKRVCPRRSRGFCWFCVSCTVKLVLCWQQKLVLNMFILVPEHVCSTAELICYLLPYN